MIKPKGWKPDTLYLLGDNVRYDHPAKKLFKGPNIWKAIDFAPTPSNGLCIRAIWTKENGYRSPKKDEWYLSGCDGFVRAYRAPNDLPGDGFFIASIVVVEMKTIQTAKIIEVY
jgi:hypothetical protein